MDRIGLRIIPYYISALVVLSATTAMAAAPASPSPPHPTPGAPKHYTLTEITGQSAPAPGSLEAAFLNGTPWIDARYRYEYVSQDGIHEKANASTLRTRIGYETAAFEGFRAGFELQDLTGIGAERFNNGVNGRTQYPTVADPENTAVNQAYIGYQGLAGTDIKAGRQLINLDNQRFVGMVDWRQLDQTFDAVSLYNTYFNNTKLFYAYVRQVNRVFGDESSVGKFIGNTHLINGSYEFAPQLKASAYTYLLDFQSATPSIRALSTSTYGLRFTGKHPASETITLAYTLEGAHQNSYGDNPMGISENYYLIEPAVSAYGLTGKLGYEMLEGDGTVAFQTPLATFHAFDGWADKFLTTPAGGLLNRYASLSYKLPFGCEWLKGTEITGVYRKFDSDAGDISYGKEFDARIAQTFLGHYTVGVEFASYRAEHFATNTDKVMAWLQVKY